MGRRAFTSVKAISDGRDKITTPSDGFTQDLSVKVTDASRMDDTVALLIRFAYW